MSQCLVMNASISTMLKTGIQLQHLTPHAVATCFNVCLCIFLRVPWLKWLTLFILGRSLVDGNGYPVQCSCLKNPMDRRAWWATVHGVAKNHTRLTFSFFFCLKLSSWYQYSEVLVAQLCLTLCDLMDYSPPGSSVHGDSPGKDTRLGCHALFQGIFPTQVLNPDLPHCRRIL